MHTKYTPPSYCRGFTLIELLVVVAILGILAAVGIPAYQGYLSNARDKDSQTAVMSIAAAQEAYKLVNGKYFYSSGSTPSKCDANETSSAAISSSLLGGLVLNTKYFYYCIYGDPSLTPPTFTSMAVHIASGKKFTVNQDGDTSACQPSSVSACDKTNRASTF